MNPRIISNRAPAVSLGGFTHIVPKGTLPNTAGGIVQVLDDTALDSILANIAADKARLGANWPGIYAGREHFIYDPNQDSAALAWFKDFQKRPDGIWASNEGLTPAGEEALKNGEYKFTSFATDRSDLQKLPGSQDGLPLFRVMAIETIGFTNQANGKELLTPITNRDLPARALGTPQDKEAATAAPANVPRDTRPRTAADLFPLGVRVFNQIVALVRNRTGYKFEVAFNAVARDNRDLFNPDFAGTDCTLPLDRIMNRSGLVNGLGPLANLDRMEPKINRVADTFFPALNREPLALKWAAVSRAVAALETLGIGRKLVNRAAVAGVSPQDWKAANSQAPEVLDFLESKEEAGKDFGNSNTFKNWSAAGKLRCFAGQIRRLQAEQGLTSQQASDQIKETQPVFWAQCILSFKPDDES